MGIQKHKLETWALWVSVIREFPSIRYAETMRYRIMKGTTMAIMPVKSTTSMNKSYLVR